MCGEFGVCDAGDGFVGSGNRNLYSDVGLGQMEKKGTEIAAMYFVNHEQIELRLRFLNVIAAACEQVINRWDEKGASLLHQLAQERVLHLAVESVTDVGSLLIDAFILRDASSYEDIVDILHGEEAFDDALAAFLLQLVKLRKPLVQDYVNWDRTKLHPFIEEMPEALPKFASAVRVFMDKELS